MPKPRIQTSVTLFGSPPWGFRLSGGKEFNQPLVITRITPGSLSAKCGLTSGDVLIAVNGQFVEDMTQDECEAKVKQAVGSLYLVVEKNAAKLTQLPSGEVTMDVDRSIYTGERDEQERISRHNRSAKPFSAYSPAPQAKDAAPNSPEAAPVKPSGFRPMSFQPKAKQQQANGSARGQPDGGDPPAAANKAQDFVTAPQAPQAAAPGGNAAPGGRRVMGPNAAVGLYSNANVQDSYKAQVDKPAGTAHNRTAQGFRPSTGPPTAPRTVKAPIMNPTTVPVFDPSALKRSAAAKHGQTVMKGPGKSRVVHAQYNTPMGMYSNDNIIDTVQAQAQSMGVSLPGAADDAGPAPGAVPDSATYRAVHRHDAAPGKTHQSRSFKMLQNMVVPAEE